MADIHHIGIRVHNLDTAVRVFEEAFDTTTEHDTTRPGGVRIAYAHFGNCRLELIEDPALADGEPGTAVIDHFAVESADVQSDIENMRSRGYASVDETPRTAAFGYQVAAFDLATFAGVKAHLVSEQGTKN